MHFYRFSFHCVFSVCGAAAEKKSASPISISVSGTRKLSGMEFRNRTSVRLRGGHFLWFPMFPERFRSRKNSPEFTRQVAGNDSPEESLDVFLTDTYLCKNCVRNRTVVQWICTISPSGDPPGRKVLGNVVVFMHSGNHQEIILKDF